MSSLLLYNLYLIFSPEWFVASNTFLVVDQIKESTQTPESQTSSGLRKLLFRIPIGTRRFRVSRLDQVLLLLYRQRYVVVETLKRSVILTAIQFLAPSVLTFGRTDVIPFHVLLRGDVSSLREFLPSACSQRPSLSSPISSGTRSPTQTSPPSSPKKKRLSLSLSLRSGSNSRPSSPTTSTLAAGPVVSVSLLRQISAEARGQKAWRNVVIGEAWVWDMPPPICPATSDSKEEALLHWAGEIRVDDIELFPSFNAGSVSVRVGTVTFHLVSRPNS